MRRRLLLLTLFGLLAPALPACNRFAGPLETRRMPRADAPGYTIDEQKMRGRERYSIEEDDPAIGPRAYNDRPSPIGR
jgi:hypothetical protein